MLYSFIEKQKRGIFADDLLAKLFLMKKITLMSFAVAALLLASCEDKKSTDKTTFQFDSSKLNQTYDLNQSVPLQIKNVEGVIIDSVVYYANSKRIGSALKNEVFNFALESERYGPKKLTAEIFADGDSNAAQLKIDVYPQDTPKVLSFDIVNEYPHDQKAYTQGLEFYGDVLIESTGNGASEKTGNKGVSSIRKVDPKTGKVLQIVTLDDVYFGEGATVLNDEIYQLTWQHNEGYVYDVNTLEKKRTFKYFQNMQGWGLVTDGEQLYMTGGDPNIYKVNPTDFSMIDYVTVATNSSIIPAINEMEWVNGKIFANVYTQDAIAIIDPKTGAVEGVLNLSSLKDKVAHHDDLDVLNGIAYNKKSDTFYVTGKNWGTMFEIRIHQK